MSRLAGFGLGLASLIACAGSVLGPAATASDQEGPDGQVKKERRIVRTLGGSVGGYLGVSLRDVTAEDPAKLKLGDERGAVVEDVSESSPAERAGIKRGDVIVRYQGGAVESVAQLVRLVRETPAGRRVAIEISRDGAAQKLQATLERHEPGRDVEELMGDLGDLPEITRSIPRMFEGPGRGMKLRDFAFSFDRGPRKLGLRYQQLEGQLASYFKLGDDGGLLVTHVDDDGPAAKAGVKAGDVLLKLNGRAVRDADDLQHEVRRLEAGDTASLTVQRDGRPVELKLTVGGPRAPRDRDGDEETT
jgi:serine protease Do